jgi:hypothetical protein
LLHLTLPRAKSTSGGLQCVALPSAVRIFQLCCYFGCTVTVNHESAAAHGRMQQLISQQITGSLS